MQRIAGKIVKWLKQQVREANAEGVVFGMSGGIDSSVVAILCKKAFPKNCLALMLPCNSNKKDLVHAKLVAKKFGIPFKVVDLGKEFESLSSALGKAGNSSKNDKNAIANIKPRLRMIALYHFANKLGFLVVGTGNKTELAIGYFTKFGDGAADLLPLAGLLKTDVKRLATYLKVPKEIIGKEPSAGLWEKQADETEIGMQYAELDAVLRCLELGKGIKQCGKKAALVKKMVEGSRHKRAMPKICRL